jgi:nucleoside-diphosphate-sugar epimerase
VGQIFIENALAGKPLRVDGDGNDKLDFTYCDDLIEGICLAICKPAAINQTFNLTYGQSRSINDLVGVVREHFPGVEVDRVERDRLMPHRGTLSIAKARSVLGYEPKYTLEKGIAKYIEWYHSFEAKAALRERGSG